MINRQRVWIQKQLALGHCITCGQPRLSTGTGRYCRPCADRRHAYQRQRRQAAHPKIPLMSPQVKEFSHFCHQQTNRIKQRFIRKDHQRVGLTTRGKRPTEEAPDSELRQLRELYVTVRGQCI